MGQVVGSYSGSISWSKSDAGRKSSSEVFLTLYSYYFFLSIARYGDFPCIYGKGVPRIR